MEQEDKGKILLQKYLEGKANAEEQAIVESWQLDFPLQNRKSMGDETALNDLAEVRQELLRISGRDKKAVVRWLSAAAAALVILGTGLWLYYSRYEQENNIQQNLYAHNIGPGKNTATLILANGKEITLSDAKKRLVIGDAGLKYEDGTAAGLDPISGADTLTAATPKGGTYQVSLPDGTRVWLNAASSIRFPSRFSGGRRKISLTGEAYFEVSKRRQPFIVTTAKQEIKVLGTHFNISSYQEERATVTTLLEGAVQVNALSGHTVTLRPGQQSVLTGPAIRVSPADTDMALAWKEGYFKFNNEPLRSIMRKLSRWYNVEVVYEGNQGDEEFGGRISRYKTLAEVLEMLQSTKMIHFKIEGRRIIVK